jgi:hypothetical protein
MEREMYLGLGRLRDTCVAFRQAPSAPPRRHLLELDDLVVEKLAVTEFLNLQLLLNVLFRQLQEQLSTDVVVHEGVDVLLQACQRVVREKTRRHGGGGRGKPKGGENAQAAAKLSLSLFLSLFPLFLPPCLTLSPSHLAPRSSCTRRLRSTTPRPCFCAPARLSRP